MEYSSEEEYYENTEEEIYNEYCNIFEDENKPDCEECGWCCEYPEAHTIHGFRLGCKTIQTKYKIYFDEDGEITWKLKNKDEDDNNVSS